MNLEKYVVLFNGVVATTPFVDLMETEINDLVTGSIKSAFHQYLSGTNLDKDFVIDIVDQHSLFPQRESDFIAICNNVEKPIIIRLRETGDILQVQPTDVLILPNHKLFEYQVSDSSLNDHNLIAYVHLLGEFDN